MAARIVADLEFQKTSEYNVAATVLVYSSSPQVISVRLFWRAYFDIKSNEIPVSALTVTVFIPLLHTWGIIVYVPCLCCGKPRCHGNSLF